MDKTGKGQGELGRKSSGFKRTAAAFVFAAAVLFAGCGASSDGSVSNAGMSDSSYSGGEKSYDIESSYGNTDSYAEGEGGASTENAVDLNRKMIRTVELSVETKEFEDTMTALEMQVKQLGGYIESMETNNGSRYSSSRKARYSYLTVRIPKEKTDSFLKTVSDVCNVTRRNESMKDVTLSYVDMESRRNTLRAEQDRLLSFLEKADTVEEIISLEARISEVRYQLESMEAKLRSTDNQVDYATVVLNVSEVQDLTPVVVEKQTVWDRIASGFVGSVKNVGHGVVEICVWLAVNIPYLMTCAVMIAVIVVIVRMLQKRDKEKREKRARQWAQTAASNDQQDNAKG